jgi:hypothetical protein
VPVKLWQLISRMRLQGLLRRVRESVWDTKYFFELRCGLEHELPAIQPAKIPIEMQPVGARTFRGFSDELSRSDAANYPKALLRTWYCRAGVETLYVARDGVNPVYAQWLASPKQQRGIPWFLPGRFPALRPGELLLEGAYTFVDYRRLGLMRDGMAQLLRFALETDASAVVTYVAVDNIASLRGCADAGFVPHRLRVSTRRLLRWARCHPIGEEERKLWEAATAKDGGEAMSAANGAAASVREG